MTYRFRLTESFEKGLRRIGERQIERAKEQLAHASPGTAVHETRKCMKRLRALLRLVRPGIGEKAFARENTRFRDIGRLLSASRDGVVVLAVIDRLAAEHKSSRIALARMRDGLAGSHTMHAGEAALLAQQVLAMLEEGGREWRELSLEPDGAATIEQGLAQGQRRLRTAFHAADSDDDETYHEWRKSVQLHWRNMRLVQAGWPAYFEVRAAEAKQVSELLGAAQDLTLFLGHLAGEPGKCLSRKQMQSLGALATEQRDTQRAAAHERCSRLAAEGADGFARRALDYWHSAANLQETDIETSACDNALAKGAEGNPTAPDKAAAPTSRPRPSPSMASRRGAGGRREGQRGPADRPGRTKR